MMERGLALVALARHAILERIGVAGPRPAAPPLDEMRGAFVTLRQRSDHDLRGCVGMIEARLPLGEAVRRAAVMAAFEDPRFPPVTLVELEALAIDVSVLGPLAPALADAIEVGRHGVVVRCDGRSALFLPQVATEQGWDRDTLLSQLCRKAGLPIDAWRRGESRLFTFETETFEEE
jgi:AmmeMemoRadiSam system protein A